MCWKLKKNMFEPTELKMLLEACDKVYDEDRFIGSDDVDFDTQDRKFIENMNIGDIFWFHSQDINTNILPN